MLIGSHVPAATPLAEAAARDADLVQMFITTPLSWKKPVARSDAEELLAVEIPVYVHAPYLMNLASPNNRVRIPSRKTLAQTVEGAAAIGAAGVIVHGGSVGDDEDVGVGFERWRKALDSFDVTVPVLVENTAGTGTTVMQDLANYGPLWDAIGDHNVGVCLDTCHAWAAGADLATAVAEISAVTGGLSLVHCNDSKDLFGSGRDRHTNLGSGMIPEELIVAAVRAANCPVVVETPGGAGDQAADIAWLRTRVG